MELSYDKYAESGSGNLLPTNFWIASMINRKSSQHTFRRFVSRFLAIALISTFVIYISSTVFAQSVATVEKPAAGSPNLVTERDLERTGFQEGPGFGPRYDLRSDFVMAYGVGPEVAERLKRWKEEGYVPQIMTGVAWGGYQAYLDGKIDGRKHWDEGQVDAAGNGVNHDETIPYMVPTVAFSDYLTVELRKLIDLASPVAIHLEEPEFWARSGFSKAFQREWQAYYSEPWQRPDASCDAQYRASKLKYYLYRRALDRIGSSLKEYSLVEHNRPIRFYVPTHSLINYSQWGIVSPESSLVELPGIDGYIAQIWTGTSRTPNDYRGQHAERTFETAFLEYGVMQELVRGTGKRMWFLHDPIEDNPRHDWNDYRRNYICTLIASLLQPDVARYEIAPWPSRVMQGKYPEGQPSAKGIDDEYATILSIAFNQLRDMEQSEVSWEKCTESVGVLLADSAMFQRAEPVFREGTTSDAKDVTRATQAEVHHFSGFFGLALPLVKHGIPARPVQLDNLPRYPGYLDPFRVLVLSYEYMKPMRPEIHQVLASWVQNGGTLLYVGADTDPFHRVHEWWNQPAMKNGYASPAEHLMECLGLGRTPKEGEYPYGKGLVLVERKHPAWFSRSAEAAERLRKLVERGVEASGGTFMERNSFVLRRGPYLIVAAMTESVSDEPLQLKGRFIDLLDARLPLLNEKTLKPSDQAWLLDLDRVTAKAPVALAAAGRIEKWSPEADRVKFLCVSPEGTHLAARLLLPAAPKTVAVGGKACDTYEWDESSKTVLLRDSGDERRREIEISW
jgi:hypothetical protein